MLAGEECRPSQSAWTVVLPIAGCNKHHSVWLSEPEAE